MLARSRPSTTRRCRDGLGPGEGAGEGSACWAWPRAGGSGRVPGADGRGRRRPSRRPVVSSGAELDQAGHHPIVGLGCQGDGKAEPHPDRGDQGRVGHRLGCWSAADPFEALMVSVRSRSRRRRAGPSHWSDRPSAAATPDPDVGPRRSRRRRAANPGTPSWSIGARKGPRKTFFPGRAVRRARRSSSSSRRGPVPWFARKVLEAEGGGVGLEPTEAGVAAGADRPAVVGEVDGQAPLVLGAARSGCRGSSTGMTASGRWRTRWCRSADAEAGSGCWPSRQPQPLRVMPSACGGVEQGLNVRRRSSVWTRMPSTHHRLVLGHRLGRVGARSGGPPTSAGCRRRPAPFQGRPAARRPVGPAADRRRGRAVVRVIVRALSGQDEEGLDRRHRHAGHHHRYGGQTDPRHAAPDGPRGWRRRPGRPEPAGDDGGPRRRRSQAVELSVDGGSAQGISIARLRPARWPAVVRAARDPDRGRRADRCSAGGEWSARGRRRSRRCPVVGPESPGRLRPSVRSVQCPDLRGLPG